MRRIALLVFGMASILARPASAAPGASSSFLFHMYANVYGVVRSEYQLGFDVAVTPQWTLGPMITLAGRDVQGIEYSYFGFGVRTNYYFSNAIGTSWRLSFIGGFIPKITLTTQNSIGNEATGNTGKALVGGVLLGGQFFIRNVGIGLGVGPEYYYMKSERIALVDSAQNSQSVQLDAYRGFGIRIEASLGYAF